MVRDATFHLAAGMSGHGVHQGSTTTAPDNNSTGWITKASRDTSKNRPDLPRNSGQMNRPRADSQILSTLPLAILFAQRPMTCIAISRFLGRLSKSRTTICCQVPSLSFPSSTRTTMEGFSNDARTWENPFPSCQASSWW